MEEVKITNPSKDDTKNNNIELNPEQLRKTIGFSRCLTKFKPQQDLKGEKLLETKNHENSDLKNDEAGKNLISTNTSLRKFNSIRSSVSTNYSAKDSLATFNQEFRDTSDFGDLSNTSNIINNSNKFSCITKFSKFSKFSEPLSYLKNSEIPSRGPMGIFNKNTRELVGVEENYHNKKLFNTIEKHGTLKNLPSDKSLPLEKKTLLDSNLIYLIDKRENFICTSDNADKNFEIDFISKPQILKNEKYTYKGYINEFKKRQGFGICIYANGDKYTGYWSDDKKEGWGRYEFQSSGKIFIGEFLNNHIDGFVEFINRNRIIHLGYMKNQKFLNKEVMIITHPQYVLNAVMDYNTSNCKLTGLGSIKYRNGITYEGETLESYEHGWGITKNPDGTIVQGLKEENTYNSYCEVFYPNKEMFFGWFQNNKKHGKGVLINNDGTYILGNYFQDLKDGGFIQLSKGEAKFELHLFGFLTKTVEKKENIISYLNLVYPEYLWLVKTNNKMLYEKLYSFKTLN